MNSKKAFLKAASALIVGFVNLVSYRIVCEKASFSIREVNQLSRPKYKSSSLDVIKQFKTVPPNTYLNFMSAYGQSMIVLTYAWFDTFLNQVEEVLFLDQPDHLGKNVTIKLGKVLDSKSLDDLLHELVKKKLRERSGWGLVGRTSDLTLTHGFMFRRTKEEFMWAASLRNNAAHNRRHGEFAVSKGKVTFTAIEKESKLQNEEVERFLRILTDTLSDLYFETCKKLGINKRFKDHLANIQMLDFFQVLSDE